MELHRLQISGKDLASGRRLTGARCNILLDGKPLKYVTGLNLKLRADTMCVATIQVLVMPDIDLPDCPVVTKAAEIKGG